MKLSLQPSIIDSSFEHEIWNNVRSPRLLLMIDFKHPDITPEDDFLNPEFWDVKNIEGQFVYQMKDEVSS